MNTARHPLKFLLIGGVVALAAIGVGASLTVMKLKGNLDAVRRSAGEANPGAADRTSLLRAENLAKAITSIASKAGPGARLIELQLEPKTARFALRQRASSAARGWIYTSEGELRPSAIRQVVPEKGTDQTFPLRQASPGMPEKIVQAIHRRDSRISLKDVQLMTLGFDPIESRIVWSVSIRRGATASLYLADPHGSHVRRPGVDPPGTSGGRASPYAGDPRAALARSERLMRCIARAHGDVAKLEACSP